MGARSRSPLSKSGAPSSVTEFGPPLRMMPVGFHALIHSSERVGGWISEYTRASRTRRAMSWVNWLPQSRIRILDDITVPKRTLSPDSRQSDSAQTTASLPNRARIGNKAVVRQLAAESCQVRALPFSKLPLRLRKLQELDMFCVQIEHRRRGRAVDPAARLARIDDQRIAARLHRLLVFAAVHDDVMRLDRTGRHVADVVHEENLVLADGQAVRRLEELVPHSLLRERLQSLGIAVVAAEHSGERDVRILERFQRKRRTEI